MTSFPDPDLLYITERELALRWRVSLRTVQRWRRMGLVPPHLLLGRSPIFSIGAVLAFEAARLAEEA